ncbi:hypothetical protein NIES4071_09530 [Calothrix sp. NIES-4071]|nr:hypothetical protein NIES4071_09530 [Calothrix sp. NIES-4071]BAZ55295.1 hypothetical protein NIES4105_09490 [Calothrix sp. NIES-4105]
MKSHYLLTILLASIITACSAPANETNNSTAPEPVPVAKTNSSTAPEPVPVDKNNSKEMKDLTGMTPQQHIEKIAANKGKFGTGDIMRRFFFGNLEPLGTQPGGAGMVVNLFNKKNDVTFSYCTTYDVVVAVKKGKVTEFPAAEVK